MAFDPADDKEIDPFAPVDDEDEEDLESHGFTVSSGLPDDALEDLEDDDLVEDDELEEESDFY